MIGRDLDFDLHNAIQDLIAEGVLEENSDAHRVARLVIHDGFDSLTAAQQALYDDVVSCGRSQPKAARSPFAGAI